MSRPPLVFYGDDFTGSADVLMQSLRLGVTGTILLGMPKMPQLEQAAASFDLVGVAGVTRAMPPERIAPIVDDVFEQFSRLSPRLIQYKVCSTADSSPTVGSFAPPIASGRARFGERPVPVLVAQPNLGRFTAFSHHFAADRGEIYRLDRQPIMSNHPVTPMREADLRIHLAKQIAGGVGGVHLPELRSADALRAAYRDAALRGDHAVVMDAVDDDDLARTGALLLELAEESPAFGVGSAGMSIGLLRALGHVDAAHDRPGIAATSLPCLAVSGSCSQLSRDQLRHALGHGWHGIAMDVGGSGASSEELLEDVLREAKAELAQGSSVVVYTCGPDQEMSPGVDVAEISAQFGRLISAVREAGLVERVLVAGGDTSGYVLSALGAAAIEARAVVGDYKTLMFRIHAPGSANDRLDVVLKGGQIGHLEFFDTVRVGEGAGHGD